MSAGSFLDSVFSVFRRSARVAPRKTVGTGGTAIVGGYIQPVDSDAALTGPQRYKTFSEILANVAIVAAGARYYLNLGAKPSWKAEPADDSPKAREIAELVDAIFEDMTTPWHRVVRRALMYRFYGFSIQEWTAKLRKDGVIGLLDVEPRPQKTIERWDVDESGTVHGLTQVNPNNFEEVYLPRGKLLYIVDDSLDDSPEGLGLFRHLADPSRRLKRLQKLEVIGYETDLRGIPVARAPLDEMKAAVTNGNLTAEEKTELEQPLRDLITNHIRTEDLAILLDSVTYQTIDDKGTPSSIPKWSFELLKGGSTGLGDVAGAIDRIIRELAWVLGVEHLLLGADSRGSHALARDKSHNFGLIVDSSLVDVRETVDADLIRPLATMNGWPEELIPKMKVGQVQYRDIEQITGAMADMANAGAILDVNDPVVGEVRDLLGLSRPPDVAAELEATDASLRPGARKTGEEDIRPGAEKDDDQDGPPTPAPPAGERDEEG